MPDSARAAVFSAPGRPLELRSFPIPELRAGEAWIRVTHATLCGSDLHSYAGRRTAPTPSVLGHEIVGRVAVLPESDPPHELRGDPLTVGDRVTWSVVASCGTCFYCQRDLPQKCQRAVKYGHEALKPGAELRGGLAEYCLLAPGTAIVRLPQPLSDELACPASCATATAAAACEAVGTLRDQRLLIVGAGLLGLTAAAMASAAGAQRVVVCDPSPERRALAERFGATDGCRPEDLESTAARVTEQQGFDCVVEMSGSPQALTAALAAARLGATIVLVGSVFPQPPEPVAVEQLVRRNLTLHGVHNYAPRHLLAAVDFLAAQPAERWAGVVARWYSLAEVAEAFAAAAGPQRPLRIGVSPSR